MKEPTDVGTNRTGIATSPLDSPKLIEAAERATPFDSGDGASIAAERVSWANGASPVGSMPPPATLKGVAKAGLQWLKGNHPNVFLDKLGERAAFERSGVRLYDALLVKHAAAHVHAGGPLREELEEMRDDELRHFAVVRDAIIGLGADPTAMTPCADVSAVLGMGFIQVLGDPRTTLTQGLEAILAAELIDNDAWAMLVDLADGLGQGELAARFRDCMREEEQHLAQVRRWLSAAVQGQAGVEPTGPQPAA